MAITSLPIAEQQIQTSGLVTGNGTPATPLRAVNINNNTILGNNSGVAAEPSALTTAQVKALLSVDDLVTLSGVADGAANLGTFSGTTIPDNATIKAALQSLETAIGSGSSISHDSLTSGAVVVAQIARFGGSACTLTNPASGEYNITIQSGADVHRISFFGNSTTVNGSNAIVIRVDNSANSRNRRIAIDLFYGSNGQQVNVFALGAVPDIDYAGNIATITIPDFGGFGTGGCWVEIR